MTTHFVLPFFLSAVAMAQSAGTFIRTGGMITPRDRYTATLLPNGKVLIAGGSPHSTQLGLVLLPLASAELYDPATGTFSRTGDMTMARAGHTATLLPNGKVLIAGRTAGAAPSLASGEVYDSSTGTFSATGKFFEAVEGPAILLANGTVLLPGGVGGQIYDPVTGTFSSTGNQVGWNGSPAGELLADGRVLLVVCCRAEQLYDPASGTFSLTGVMARVYEDGFASALPASGKFLVTGGYDEEFGQASAGACLYDSATGTFAATGDMNTSRYYHTATPLGDGTVLVAGGFVGNSSSSATATAELYDPAAGTFSRAGDMTTVRMHQTATLLVDGTVLILAGDSSGASAEIYHPTRPVPAPMLFSLLGAGQRQGAIWHAATGQAASANNPAVAGEALSMYTTSLVHSGVVPPQVAVGGQLAEILFFGDAPGYPGYYQLNFRVPRGLLPGLAVPIRLTYLGRPSNEVTLSVGETLLR